MSPSTVTLADVGEGLAEAEIVRWLVAEGDQVVADQPIVEVETDKAVIELPAPVTGVLSHSVAEGEVVAVGAELGVIAPLEGGSGVQTTDRHPDTQTAGPEALGTEVPAASTGEHHTSDATGREPSQQATTPPMARSDRPSGPAPRHDAAVAPVVGGRPGRILASPANRRRAREQGIDLTTVPGSGPGGRITSEDLVAAAQTPGNGTHARATPPSGAGGHEPSRDGDDGGSDSVERPLSGRRRSVAETMTRSWQEIPHITEMREIDATQLLDAHRRLRSRLEEEGGLLAITPLLARATVAALRRHPDLHASLDLERGRVLQHRRCHLGIAVATDQGLVVPVVTDADRRSLIDLATTTEQLAALARENRLGPGDVRQGTFTITNFGSLGVWLGTPIIRPPEVAIAGFGRITERAVAVEGQAVVRPVLPVAVSADHRLVDGDRLARFVTELETLLSDPMLLLAEAV